MIPDMRTGNDYDLATILGPPWAGLVGIETNDDDSSGGGSDDSGDDDQTDDQGDDDADSGDDDKDDDKITLTRAELDAKIERRLARERRRANRQRDDGKGKGQNDDKDTGDDKDPMTAIARRLDAMEERDRERETERATERLQDRAAEIAKDSGVRPDRVRAAVRQAELDGLRATDTDDISDAISDVLDMFPEWKAEKGRPRARSSTRDDTSNNGSGPKVWTEDEIARLSDKEYDKHAEEIEKAVADGRVKRTASK